MDKSTNKYNKEKLFLYVDHIVKKSKIKIILLFNNKKKIRNYSDFT